jgi:plasmid stabilization system protein ParE
MNRVVITPQAEQDIRAIYRHIRREAPDAASRWRKGIRAHIKTLARSAERAPLAPENETFDEVIRQLLYGKGNRGTYRISVCRSGKDSVRAPCPPRVHGCSAARTRNNLPS